MKIKTLISIILLCPTWVWQVKAQVKNNPSDGLEVRARMIEGTPTIKIIPSVQATWFKGMKNGYEISISEFKNGSYSEYRVLEPRLMPAAEDAFRSPDLPEDYAEGMRKIVYEETFAPASQSFNDLAEANEVMGRMFYGYLLLSSYDPKLSEMSGLQMQLPANVSDVFKVKVKINGTDIAHEQNMLLRAFYKSLASPSLNVKPEDHRVSLLWNHSNYKMQFIAYSPERSTDGKNYRPLGAPTIFTANSSSGKLGLISVKDSLSANYENYWYRLAGYDVFGILSDYTEPVKVMGHDKTAPPEPRRVQVSEGKAPGEVNVSWAAEASPDLLGFQVIASQSEEGDYQLMHKDLMPADAREFTITFDKKPPLFYRVLSVDTARNAASSSLGYLIVYDSIPPALPIDFEAKADTNYVVTIKWSKSTSEDVKGYRLYKAYSPSNGFVPITGLIITDTTYYDTLADDRLDKNVYYQLVALDTHYNHSKKSEYIFAPVPDRVPPTAPLLMKADLEKGNKVSLEWRKSSSDDVISQTVLRRMPDDSTFMEIAVLTPSDSAYTDTEKDNGAADFVEYYIVAIDSSGNHSKRSNGKRILYKQDRDHLVVVLRSAIVEDGNIRLVWKYPAEGNYSVLVYRAAQDEDFELIGRVNEGDSYLDSSVAKGKEYRYKIGAMKANGNRMPLSEVMRVDVE